MPPCSPRTGGAFLRAVHGSLAPGGHYLMMEPKASSNLEDNIGHPFAPLLYATSALHCTVFLAGGGAGPGTTFGEQKVIEMLTVAGFTGITVAPAPGDPWAACSPPPGRRPEQRSPGGF